MVKRASGSGRTPTLSKYERIYGRAITVHKGLNRAERRKLPKHIVEDERKEAEKYG